MHAFGFFDPLTLLTMWCETTPATIFPDRKIGRLQDGYEASFLVLDGNPLDDFTNTGRITLRVKQGHLLPGSRIPIHAPEKIFETQPDYVLILPWNLKDEIMKQMSGVREWGCKFVVSIPETVILD